MDQLPLFWQQVLQYWCDFNYCSVAKTPLENISSQGYWLNSCIKINGSVVYSPELFDKANTLKCFFKPGRFIKVREWNQDFVCIWSDLDFLKIIHAIPHSWVLSMLHNPDIQHYCRKTHFSELITLANKHASHVYQIFLQSKITKPSCISKWEQYLNDTEIDESWFHALILLKKIIPMNIGSIQYKFLHHLYMGNYALHAAGLVASDVCQYCHLPEMFLHMFWDCPLIEDFWFSLWSKVAKFVPESTGYGSW